MLLHSNNYGLFGGPLQNHILEAAPATMPATLQALSYYRPIAASSQKVRPEVLHKGDYSEQFLSHNIVLPLGFTECAASVSYHTFLAIITML